ncbi:signal peptide peptidase SppA [Oceanobacillus halotolerans]|uniref:signal peptide peptidase SppA n=1 Tax=Oceanobacillus halotolerans TaxID=2663380 RepID=UPI0013DA9C8D|nr:signal peptide peptidase SppA [Oceanobacillus halotolerans]
MNGKRWIALLIAVGLFVVSVGFQFFSSIATANFENVFNVPDTLFEEEVIQEGTSQNKIAVLDVEGVIQDTGGGTSLLNQLAYNHQRFLKMLEEAGQDPSVDGIILRINTPGGGVVESAEVHDKVVEVQEEYNKPVYVSMGNTAASGGYYISAPADKIVANPATLTGSIGVIMESINFADLAEEWGIDFNTIKSGEYKDIMSTSRDMTDDEEEILQSMVDEMYADFVQVIVDGRDMSEQRVRELGDGRVYTGSQAMDVGLVDALGSFDETVEMMEEDFELGDTNVIRYRTNPGFNELFMASAQSLFGERAEINGLLEMIRQADGPRAMYLYSK